MAIRIATVYRDQNFKRFNACDMSMVRWLRISEALAAKGYEVDIVVNCRDPKISEAPGLNVVPYAGVRWRDYDVIKTLFHRGFDSLHNAGGSDHPCIISKLGSVVGRDNGVGGVHFVGEERERMYQTQVRINEKAKWITLLTEPSRMLWRDMFGDMSNVLLVPTGVNREIPPRGPNPYPESGDKVAIYIGNLYTDTQRHINLAWQRKLDDLGRRLRRNGVRLYTLGPGATDIMDPEYVTCLGAVSNDAFWQYQYYADVGIVLAQGCEQHNESSKIYYYLRTGLPVVSEYPVPNNHLITDCGLGHVVPYGDVAGMAEKVLDAADRHWPRERAIDHIVRHHTWEKRVDAYAALIGPA